MRKAPSPALRQCDAVQRHLAADPWSLIYLLPALQNFMAGPKFQGVKMLPPGAHMVSYNAAGRGQQRQQELGPTTSFFLHLASGQVEVRRWDAQQELLVELEEDEVGPAW